ncbi:MAG: hypothetical protein Q8P41_28005 [Pseudomonadota bacterium]|nr:hypothetical protein [Pseudomonadota bacterium]
MRLPGEGGPDEEWTEERTGLARRLLDGGLLVLCVVLTAISLVAVVFYAVGNGLNSGALALATLPVLLLAGPYALANPTQARGAGGVALLLLTLDGAYATWRVTRVVPDPALSVCVDGVGGAASPWLGRLVREDETAYAGMALSSAFGALSLTEAPVIDAAIRRVYGDLAARRGGRPGPNALALSSTADRVTTLVSMPPGDGPVPALIFLHGYGGLLTPYLSTLADSPLGERYAIVAPALDLSGHWWGEVGQDVLARTLDTLPARVDPTSSGSSGSPTGPSGPTGSPPTRSWGRGFAAPS